MSESILHLHPRTQDLLGRTFGHLRVDSFAGYRKGARWNCACECGVTKEILGNSLIRGVNVTCGCHKRFTPTDDLAASQPEYATYSSMLDRCRNKNCPGYHRYGGRGIVVCEKWLQGFWHFLEDVGRRPSPLHTLDRFPNNNGNYEPGNVRWATKKQQSRNTRTNVFLTFNGQTKTLVEWAEETGINYRTLKARAAKGFSIERILSTESLTPQCSPSLVRRILSASIENRGDLAQLSRELGIHYATIIRIRARPDHRARLAS